MRKFLSMLLAIVMVVGLLSGTALATDGTATTSIKIGGVEMVNGTTTTYYVNGADGAAGTLTGSEDNYNAKLTYDSTGGYVLTLNGLNVIAPGDNTSYSCGIKATADLTIVLAAGSNNTVTGGAVATAEGNSFGICVDDGSLIITGTGTLTAAGGTITNGNSYGIYAYSSVTISSGTVTAKGGTVTAGDASSVGNSYGIHAGSDVTISSGTVIAEGGDIPADVNGNSSGIYSMGGDVTIDENATVESIAGTTYGIYVIGSVDISGKANGTITGGTGISAKGNVTIAQNAKVGAITGTNGNGITGSSGVTISGTVDGDITGGIYSMSGNVTIDGTVAGSITGTGAGYSGIYGTSVSISGTVGNVAGSSYGIYGLGTYNSDTEEYTGGVTISGTVGNITGNAGIRSNMGNVTISGTVGDITGTDASGIFAGENVTVSGRVTGGITGGAYGIQAYSTVTISKGTLTVTGDTGAIAADSGITLIGVVITTPENGRVMGFGDTSIYYGIADEKGNVATTAVFESAVWVNGILVTNANASDVLGDTDEGAAVTYDPDTSTLTLNDASITSGYEYSTDCTAGIYANCDLTIKLSGNSSVTDTAGKLRSSGIYVLGDLYISSENADTLTATGSNVTATDNNAISEGISVSGKLTVSGASVTANGGEVSGNNAYSRGVYTQGGLYLKDNGTLNATGGAATSGTASYQNAYSAGVAAEANSNNYLNLNVYDGTLTATGGEATANATMEAQANSYGIYGIHAGLYVSNTGAKVTLKADTATISNGDANSAARSNGIRVSTGDIDITAGEVSVSGGSVSVSGGGSGDATAMVAVGVEEVGYSGGCIDFGYEGTLISNPYRPSGPNVTIKGGNGHPAVSATTRVAVDNALVITSPEGGKVSEDGYTIVTVNGDAAQTVIIELQTYNTVSNDEYWFWALMMLYNQQFDVTATATEGGTITPAGVTKVKYDKNITYTITPDEGYAIADVLVNGESVGAVSEYTIKRVKKDHVITAIFAKIPWQNPYSDVTAEDWFYEDVKFVSENNLMIGTVENESFAPHLTATRAMVVTILWRMEGEPIAESSVDFFDVPADTWYSAAVSWASANGIVLGYDGLFHPENPITREQLAAILLRYAAYKGMDNGVIFPMIPQYKHSEWAENDGIWADMNGLLDGIGNDMHDMTADASRAEVAAMLRRFCEKFAEK